MRRDDRTPEAYRADVEGVQREILEAVRDVVLQAAPDVEECIGHGMLDYPGMANLGPQKHYVALYVAPAMMAKHRSSFPGVDAVRCCLRFRKPEQVDRQALLALLREVRAFRASAEERS